MESLKMIKVFNVTFIFQNFNKKNSQMYIFLKIHRNTEKSTNFLWKEKK